MGSFLSTDSPDLQEIIHSLDLLNENVNKAVVNAMHKGANIIVNEQKRLAAGYPRLVKHITKGQMKVSRSGKLTIDCGYNDEAFRAVEGKTNMGVYGVSVEFGRPGTGKRSKKTMEQTRHGEKFVVGKGTIQPQSHIIRGFENKAEAAADAVVSSVNEALDKTNRGQMNAYF